MNIKPVNKIIYRKKMGLETFKDKAKEYYVFLTRKLKMLVIQSNFMTVDVNFS